MPCAEYVIDSKRPVIDRDSGNEWWRDFGDFRAPVKTGLRTLDAHPNVINQL